jgi:hypothetical protein
MQSRVIPVTRKRIRLSATIEYELGALLQDSLCRAPLSTQDNTPYSNGYDGMFSVVSI